MIYVDENKLKSLNAFKENDVYILTDFDGTLTEKGSDSSWASIFKNPYVSKDFVDACVQLFMHYHKYEIDENLTLREKLPIMEEWYQKNIETLKEFKITKSIINYAANENALTLRKGAPEFLKIMNDKQIPIIIISAGVGNIIEEFLKRNNLDYPNIYICSNFLEFDNQDIVKSVRDGNLIHSLNKSEVSIPLNIKRGGVSYRSKTILLGDAISDTFMSTNKDTFKIGFLDEKIEERIASFKE